MATSYIRTLSDLMLSTEVTEKNGASMSLDEGAERAVQMILAVAAASGKVMLTGNGGSAAIVSHIQNDLCKTAGVRALVFTEQPLLMALANDDGYGCIFERPAELWADAGDLMMAVSSSGRSENILRGVQASLKRNCNVITFSGFGPENPLRRLGDVNFYVRSDVYGYVETAHATLAHFVTDRARTIVKAG